MEYWNESWALERYGCEVAARFHPSGSRLGTRDCVDDCNLLKNITTKANALRMFHVPLNHCVLRNLRIIRNRSIEGGRDDFVHAAPRIQASLPVFLFFILFLSNDARCPDKTISTKAVEIFKRHTTRVKENSNSVVSVRC